MTRYVRDTFPDLEKLIDLDACLLLGGMYVAVSILCNTKLETLCIWDAQEKMDIHEIRVFCCSVPATDGRNVRVLVRMPRRVQISLPSIRSILLVGSELTPLFHFSLHDCFIWQVFQGVAAATIICTVDTILILRSELP